MQPRIKLTIKIFAVILIVLLTSFITKKSESWFKPITKIEVIFHNSIFPGIPELRPLRDVTRYTFDTCDFTGKRWGETITPSEVDKAITKLEEKKK